MPSIFPSLVALVFASSAGTDPLRENPPAAAAEVASVAGVITGVTFNWNSHRREAIGSDNWPATWADDNNQYAVFGDGGGFGGADHDGRVSFGVARIEGDPSNYRGVNRFGGKGGECASEILGKGHGAPLSIAGILYVWITPRSDAVGYEQFTLYMSADKACTWTALDVRFTLATDGISFGSFVQFGQDDSASLDGYVYTVAAEVTDASSLKIVQRPGRIVLLRVPAVSMNDRRAYEFYAGLDASGAPTWSPDPAAKIPIYEDPAGVGPFPQMSYVPDLGRFVYTNQHGNGVDVSGARSLLTMADAPSPWGPWNVFHKGLFFPQLEQTVFQWSFAPKWFRNSGREFTLIFSGGASNDSWNTVDGVFTSLP